MKIKFRKFNLRLRIFVVYALVFRIHWNFFILLPIRLKICFFFFSFLQGKKCSHKKPGVQRFCPSGIGRTIFPGLEWVVNAMKVWISGSHFWNCSQIHFLICNQYFLCIFNCSFSLKITLILFIYYISLFIRVSSTLKWKIEVNVFSFYNWYFNKHSI